MIDEQEHGPNMGEYIQDKLTRDLHHFAQGRVEF
jgi:hypothetical protein